MVKAKYHVLDVLKQLAANTETDISTKDIAATAQLTRGVTSSYLSQLHKEGLISKYGTKPVYWALQQQTDIFDQFIGANGSLKAAITAAKSAINYPPHGFPLIITGPSGVGKSYLASLIFKYAQKSQVIDQQAQFVTLNCADYANNPELLSSVLFGYRKGAFTGASQDTPGLVDQANGGYLFLDEIHRLPIESQEKLFTLLDTGTFYPLGENEQAHHVQVRFIFATTEDLDNYLLQTFRRRVPLTITLASFDERPLLEKYQLILHFFYQESQAVQKNLLVSYQTLKQIAAGPVAGNIGSIHNKVKLMVAAAYGQQSNSPQITVGTNQTNDLQLTVDYQQVENFAPILATQIQSGIAQLFDQLLTNERQTAPIADQILVLRGYLHDAERSIQNFQLNTPIVTALKTRLQGTLKQFKHRYGIPVSETDHSVTGTAQFLATLLSGTPDIKQATELQQLLNQHYPRTAYLTKQFVKLFSDNTFPEKMIEMPVFFLILSPYLAQIESIKMLAILVSHGETMASSIQSVVNNLCGTYIFESFDMPIDVSVKAISQRISKFVSEKTATYQGTVLMFDMGSLSQMYKEIKPLLSSDLLVINNLTTATALDIGLQMQHGDFKQVAQQAESYRNAIQVQYYEGLSQKQNIIVSCMSGVGLSNEIKRIMTQTLQTDTDIITMDYKDLKQTLTSHGREYFKNTYLILTTTDIPQQAVTPIINIYDIMDTAGEQRLQATLSEIGEQKRDIDALMEELLQFFTIEGISSRLQFLNPQIVIKEVQGITKKYENYYHLNLSGKIKLNLYMHISLMLERMLISSHSETNQSLTTPQDWSAQQTEFYSITKNIFHDVEVKYNIVVDDYEISLMYELLRRFLN